MRAVQERSGIRRAIAGQDRSQSERLVRAAMYLALCLLAAVGMGCGDDSGDDDGGSADGGGSADCLMRILPIDSDTLVQGQSITLSGAIEYGSGFEEYQWYVSHEDAVITADSAEPSVTFVAELAGVYQIVLDGSKGIQCDSDQLSLNVEASNARQQRYRLRAIPDSTLRAAPTERELTVVGGANNYWGALVLRGDDSLSGTVRDSDGAILPAFVRVQTEAGQVVGEAVTDGAGRFEIFAEADAYELVVIPADNLTAPRSFQVTAPADDAYIIDRGEPVSGVVRDGAGNPLSGARVSVNMDDLPSTLASTDDSGAFTVYARPTTGAALAVVVTPPADSGLPVAELAGEAGLQFGNEALVIEYSAALSTRAVSLPVHSSDGSPAPAMTRAIWTAEPITGAATVRVGPVSAPAMGRVLLSAEVGTDGATDEIHLPAGLYTVVVEPPSSSDDSGSAAVHAVDLSADTEVSAVALAPLATVSGQTVSAEKALAGVQITAVPLGPVAGISSASASAESDGDGHFQLALVAGAEYQLRLATRDRAYARTTATITAPAIGQPAHDLGPLHLPAALAVSGEIGVARAGQSAQPADGVHVILLCHECTGAEASLPVAEGVTKSDGSFVLAVPDPGVDTGAGLKNLPSPEIGSDKDGDNGNDG